PGARHFRRADFRRDPGQGTGRHVPAVVSAMAPRADTLRRRDIAIAMACGLFVAGMVGAAYAAVPLYNWFRRAPGVNGTTQVATAAPGTTLDRKVTVRFDANVGPGLPWRFEPEVNSI